MIAVGGDSNVKDSTYNIVIGRNYCNIVTTDVDVICD